jgi:hypothetical protein
LPDDARPRPVAHYLAITLAVFGCNVFDDALDPRLRGSL